MRLWLLKQNWLQKQKSILVSILIKHSKVENVDCWKCCRMSTKWLQRKKISKSCYAIKNVLVPYSFPDEYHSKFIIKLYNWFSTTKWTGRHERLSWVAGSQVSQERALYCSKTNLRTSEVWFESSGCECLLCNNSSDCTEGTWRCREALRNSGHWFCAWGHADQNQSGNGPALAVETK